MGKCIQCGKETQNLYLCYSADMLGQIVRSNRATKTKTTTTTYCNFQQHQAYVCNECIHNKGAMRCSIVMFIILLLVGIGLSLFIAFNIPKFFAPFSTSVIFPLGMTVLSFGGAYTLIRRYLLAAKDRETDKRKDDDSKYYSGSCALTRMLNNQNPGRVYFTPSRFAELGKK